MSDTYPELEEQEQSEQKQNKTTKNTFKEELQKMTAILRSKSPLRELSNTLMFSHSPSVTHSNNLTEENIEPKSKYESQNNMSKSYSEVSQGLKDKLQTFGRQSPSALQKTINKSSKKSTPNKSEWLHKKSSSLEGSRSPSTSKKNLMNKPKSQSPKSFLKKNIANVKEKSIGYEYSYVSKKQMIKKPHLRSLQLPLDNVNDSSYDNSKKSSSTNTTSIPKDDLNSIGSNFITKTTKSEATFTQLEDLGKLSKASELKSAFKLVYDLIYKLNEKVLTLSQYATKQDLNDSLSKKSDHAQLISTIEQLKLHVQERPTYEELEFFQSRFINKESQDQSISSKVDKQEITQLKDQVNTHVSQSELDKVIERIDAVEQQMESFATNQELQQKISSIEDRLESLVNKTEMFDELAKKADKQSVNNALTRKVNKTDLEMLLERFADKGSMLSLQELVKSDQVTKDFISDIEKKLSDLKHFHESILSFKEKICRLDDQYSSVISLESQFKEFTQTQSKLLTDRIDSTTLNLSERINNKADEKLDKLSSAVQDKLDDLQRKSDLKHVEFENKQVEFYRMKVDYLNTHVPELEKRLSTCEHSVTALDSRKADLEQTNKALMYKADALLVEEQLQNKQDKESLITILDKKANVKDMIKLLDKKASLKFFEQTVSVIIEEIKGKASESTLEFAQNSLAKGKNMIGVSWNGQPLNNFNLLPWDCELFNFNTSNQVNQLHSLTVKEEGFQRVECLVSTEKPNYTVTLYVNNSLLISKDFTEKTKPNSKLKICPLLIGVSISQLLQLSSETSISIGLNGANSGKAMLSIIKF